MLCWSRAAGTTRGRPSFPDREGGDLFPRSGRGVLVGIDCCSIDDLSSGRHPVRPVLLDPKNSYRRTFDRPLGAGRLRLSLLGRTARAPRRRQRSGASLCPAFRGMRHRMNLPREVPERSTHSPIKANARSETSFISDWKTNRQEAHGIFRDRFAATASCFDTLLLARKTRRAILYEGGGQIPARNTTSCR